MCMYVYVGISLHEHALKGSININNEHIYYASGTSVARWPQHGIVYTQTVHDAVNDATRKGAVVLAMIDYHTVYKSKTCMTPS